MAELALQCQSKAGRVRIRIAAASTFLQLQERLAAECKVPVARQRLKVGFPPRPLEASAGSLAEAGLHSGDTIVVEEAPEAIANTVPAATPAAPVAAAAAAAAGQVLMQRKVVDANNSCLFNSIGYLLENKRLDLSDQLRATAAGMILSQPETFSEAVLGRPPEAYCAWLLEPANWGGYIELQVFSKFYKTQVVAVDIQTLKAHRFGEEDGFTDVCYVIYDGIHYDPSWYRRVIGVPFDGAPQDLQMTVFPADDAGVLARVVALATEAQRKRQFTDLAGFSLRCLACQTPLKGQADAQKHAKATGHTNFGEV